VKEEGSMEINFSIYGVQRERKGSRPEVEEDLTGGPRLAVRHKESTRVGWLGWPEAKRDGLRSPGRRGRECGRGTWARLSPRTREVFDIFHFVNIRLEFKIQIFFILNQF